MTDREKTEVHLQITSGILRLSTDDAVYYISAPAGPDPASSFPGPDRRMLPETMEQPLSRASMPAASSPMVTIDPSLSETSGSNEKQAELIRKTQKESEYFKTLTRKYHQSLGLLARQAASGLSEPGAATGGAPAEAADTGPGLERLAALMAEAEKLQSTLASLSGLEIMTEEEKAALAAGMTTAAPSQPGLSPLLEKCRALDNSVIEVLNRVSEVLQKPAPVPAPPPPPQPKAETKAVKRLFFPLNDLFQIVYELAIGEEVKKAIKVVWDGMAEFDEDQINKALHPLSESFEIDDGFVLVPLEPLFKSMFLASPNESFRSTIKKLNANREKLFLDQSLPVEERYKEIQEKVEAPAPAAPPPPKPQPAEDHSGLQAELDGLKKKLADHLEELKNIPAGPAVAEAGPSPVADQLLASLIIRNAGSLNLPQELAVSEKLMTDHLAGLQEMEKLIGAMAQAVPAAAPAGPAPDNALILQLLNILVEFNTRMDLSAEYVDSGGANIEGAVTDKLADLKRKLGLEAGEAELDPKILNFLLSDMGF